MESETHQHPKFDLRSARLNAGLSVKGLADASGVSPATINRLERDQMRLAHAAVLKRLADYFGVQVTDLLPGEGRESGRPEQAA